MLDDLAPIRVYTCEEQHVLDIASQGMLMKLVQTGIISPLLREMILENIDYYLDEEITPMHLRSLILDTLEESSMPRAKMLRAKILWFFDNESGVRH